MPVQEHAPRVDLEQLNLQFPPLPQTLLEAVELMHQPGGPDVGRTADVVERDPIVVARLLNIVNSAYYRRGREIGNARRAVVALGPVSVTGIVMSMNLQDVQTALNEVTAVPFLNLIRHSLAVGFLARHLAENDPVLADSPSAREFAATAFTAGLLHDFGKVVLLYNFPEETAELYMREGEAATREEERAVCGISHIEAGAVLAERLSVPRQLAAVIDTHHGEPPFGIDDDQLHYLVTIVAAANRGAHLLGYGANGGADGDDTGEEPFWTALAAGVGYADGPALIEAQKAVVDKLEGYVSTML